jgi:dTDP-4-dehydrorhamnose reductase
MMLFRKKKVLILGGSGFLGINFTRYCKDFDLVVTYSKSPPTIQANWIKFDFSSQDKQALSELIDDVRPDIIINCIALADVDRCEQLPEQANLLNTTLPLFAAEIAEEREIKFVQISTDHFKSRDDEPRSENVEIWPVNVYGNSKKVAEDLVHTANANSLILRTNFFGFSYGKNNTLLEKILNSISKDMTFHGFSDVFFNPLSVSQLIQATEYLCSINSRGFYNIVSNTVISKFDFALSAAKVFGFNPNLIIPVTSSHGLLQVDRPNYLALDSAKYSRTGAPRIPEVKEMLLELKEDTLWMDKLRS